MKLIFIHFLILVSICNGLKKKFVFTVDRYEMCGDPKLQGLSVVTVVRTYNHESFINGTIEFHEDVEEISIFSSITRCYSKENLNTCQYFGKIPLYDACPLMARNDTMFASITFNFSPPFTCPFRKGKYILRNGYINVDLPFFPMEGYYWKVEHKYSNKKTGALLMKVCLEGQIVIVIV